MKKILLLFISLLSVTLGLTQEIRIIGISTTTGTLIRDTVFIGFRTNATSGIDASLGEIALSPFSLGSPIDMRILQRDSLHFTCLNDGSLDNTPIYFSENFDSKKNYRNKGINAPDKNRFFEIWFHANNFQQFTFLSDVNISSILESMLIYNDSCTLSPFAVVFTQFPDIKTFQVNTPVPSHSCRIVFKESIFTSSLHDVQQENIANISPNPTVDDFQVNFTMPISGYARVFGACGKVITEKQFVDATAAEISLSKAPTGLYYLWIFDDHNRTIGQMKVIKM